MEGTEINRVALPIIDWLHSFYADMLASFAFSSLILNHYGVLRFVQRERMKPADIKQKPVFLIKRSTGFLHFNFLKNLIGAGCRT